MFAWSVRDEDSAQPYVSIQADRYFRARELRPWVLGRLQTLWAVQGSTWKLSEASSFTPAQKQAASRWAHQPVVPVRRTTRSWTSFCFLFTWPHMMLLERLSFYCYRNLQSPAAGKRRGIDCKPCPTRDLASLCSEGTGSGLEEGGGQGGSVPSFPRQEAAVLGDSPEDIYEGPRVCGTHPALPLLGCCWGSGRHVW